MSPTRLESLLATADSEPFDFFDRARDAGDVIWDEELNAWLVVSYRACKELMRSDKKRFRHPYGDVADAAMIEIEGGPRSMNFLHGDEHARYHRWYMHALSPRLVDRWRARYLRPVIDEQLDRIAAAGCAELAHDYCERIPVRMIAAVMGLPWRDETWIEECKTLMDIKMEFLEDRHANGADEDITRRGREAALALKEMVRPFCEQRRQSPSDDLISLFWADGSSILPDWDLDDVLAGVVTAFFAGTDTTTHALENGVYLLIANPHLQDEVRTADPRTLSRFADEVLRIYGAVQFRPRLANADTELAGVAIKKDDLLISLHASANRDPQRYERPGTVDLRREKPRDHLAFSFGPRTCGGMALARGEIEETLALTVRRLRHIRLDPDHEPPRMRSLLLRSYRPLYARYADALA